VFLESRQVIDSKINAGTSAEDVAVFLQNFLLQLPTIEQRPRPSDAVIR